MSRTLEPFNTNIEHVEAELTWLQFRCAEIAAAINLAEAEREEADADAASKARLGRIDSRLARCRAHECREEEDRLRAEIDARLALTPDTVRLGLVQVMRVHGLGTDEKTVLLVSLAHAIGA
ncbi:MAG TPA: hypothetical protein PLP01_17315, partial [Phycisphaerae bacterium]|nr:hypothetical protein [Phycisphaerae bacterium]